MEITIIASGSQGNAYHISDGQTQVLIECGVPLKKIQEALNFRLTDVDACLISHEHKDHCKAAKDLIHYGIHIYSSQKTLTALELLGHHRSKRIVGLCAFKLGSFRILPFDINHDVKEPLGFLIESELTKERLLFFTDTYYLRYTFKNLHYIMAECNYSTEIMDRNLENRLINATLKNRVVQSHMSLETLKEFMMACDLSQLKKIYLMHLSDTNADEAAFKRQIQALTGVEVYVC